MVTTPAPVVDAVAIKLLPVLTTAPVRAVAVYPRTSIGLMIIVAVSPIPMYVFDGDA